MKARMSVIAAFVAALLFSASVSAQDAALREHLRKAEATDMTVRVTMGTPTLDGRISAINDSTFSIRNQHVFLRDVTALHRKTGSSTGAKVGAVVGAIGVGALGGLAYALCGNDCDDTRGAMLIAGGIATGGVLGGLIGGGIDGKDAVLEPIWTRAGAR